MEPYVYHEYPKCLYAEDGSTHVVQNAEEERLAVVVGYVTAAEYHAPTPVKTPAPSEV